MFLQFAKYFKKNAFSSIFSIIICIRHWLKSLPTLQYLGCGFMTFCFAQNFSAGLLLPLRQLSEAISLNAISFGYMRLL